MRALYGPGIAEILHQGARQASPGGILDADDPDDHPLPATESARLQMRLKRKRQAGLLRQILDTGGYRDLAKMVTFKHAEAT